MVGVRVNHMTPRYRQRCGAGGSNGQTVNVDLSADFEANCTAATLFGYVADLGSYPRWFVVVHRAQFLDVDIQPGNGHVNAAPSSETGLAVGGVTDPGGTPVAADPPAWTVDLRGRFGPMARSKRLRMIRTVFEPDTRVRFERSERDGRQHAAWVLDATVSPTTTGSRLHVDLHYGGQFGGSLLRRMLADEIERARPRLAELVASG